MSLRIYARLLLSVLKRNLNALAQATGLLLPIILFLSSAAKSEIPLTTIHNGFRGGEAEVSATPSMSPPTKIKVLWKI